MFCDEADPSDSISGANASEAATDDKGTNAIQVMNVFGEIFFHFSYHRLYYLVIVLSCFVWIVYERYKHTINAGTVSSRCVAQAKQHLESIQWVLSRVEGLRRQAEPFENLYPVKEKLRDLSKIANATLLKVGTHVSALQYVWMDPLSQIHSEEVQEAQLIYTASSLEGILIQMEHSMDMLEQSIQQNSIESVDGAMNEFYHSLSWYYDILTKNVIFYDSNKSLPDMIAK